jgi:hypothetical protein
LEDRFAARDMAERMTVENGGNTGPKEAPELPEHVLK